MKDKMFDVIIFDIGKVLVDFTPEEFLRDRGIDESKVRDVCIAMVENNVWDEYDRGIMTETEVLEKFIENSPSLEKEIRIGFKNLKGIVKKYDYTDKWIKELQDEGYKVLYLSNLSEKLYRECREELSFVDHMDGGILSFEDKMKKPEKEIFLHIIDKCKIKPERSIFIDDREDNVTMAASVGFKTILFTTREDVCYQIKECTA